MSIKQTIKNFINNETDILKYRSAYKCEIKKFQNKKRQEIAGLYPLNKEQREQIDDLYITNYGEKIDYIWHQNYAAHANRFDCRFLPELLYIPEFERFQNQNEAANQLLSDKNFLPVVAKTAGVKMPHTIISCTNGILRDEDNHIITEAIANEILKSQNMTFAKPSTSSCSGQCCRLLSKTDNYGISDNMLNINNVSGGGYTHNYVIQSVVTTHPVLAALHPESVNTFRIITYLWKGVVENMPVILRIGRGKSNVDNAHAGGMFIAVYADGTLGDHAVTEFNQQYTSHPDTNIVFKNYKIAFCDKMVNAAKRMHEMVPQLGVVNWDFTIDENSEPILIEANISGGSVWLPQMAHGVGAFGEKTEEVLQWLRFMKRLKMNERNRFVGGKKD